MLLGEFPGVPSRFLQQIQRGEYVNFDSLYSAIIFGSTTKPGFSIIIDDQSEHSAPSLSLVSKSVDEKKGKIRNFSAWLRTWNTFMSVFLHFRPHLISQLLSYQDSVTQLASTYFLQYWLAYDSAYRQKRANNPFLRWDVEDPQLFIAYLRTAPVLAAAALPVTSAGTSSTQTSSVTSPSSSSSSSSRPPPSGCFNCGYFGHKAKNCPYAVMPVSHPPQPPTAPSPTQAFPLPGSQTHADNNSQQAFRAPQRYPARGQQRAGGTGGYCFDWNNGRPCPPGCQRDHRCSHCAKLHPRHSCSQYPPNQF